MDPVCRTSQATSGIWSGFRILAFVGKALRSARTFMGASAAFRSDLERNLHQSSGRCRMERLPDMKQAQLASGGRASRPNPKERG